MSLPFVSRWILRSVLALIFVAAAVQGAAAAPFATTSAGAIRLVPKHG
jgi:hypothetical protein